MKLNVLFFAIVRERVGASAATLECRDGATVAEICALLVERHPSLEPLLGSTRVAVNGEFASADDVVSDGAEVVLIPPVAGGAGDESVALTDEVLDPARLQRLVAHVSDAAHGATVTFIGTVRDHAHGRHVTALRYEAYEAMALAKLAELVREVEADVPGTKLAVVHRVGQLAVGDVAILIAAGSAHRKPAFAACERLIDRIKQDVPIWKKETGPDGSEWVSEGS